MPDSGVFERRTTGEARVVYAASMALCGLGWASTVWPVVPGLIFAAIVAVGVVVGMRRRAARTRVTRAVRAQWAWEQGPPRYDEVGDVFGAPHLHAVDAERDAA